MNDETTRAKKRIGDLVQEVQAEMFSTANYIIAAQHSLKIMFSTLHTVQMLEKGETAFDGQLTFFD